MIGTQVEPVKVSKIGYLIVNLHSVSDQSTTYRHWPTARIDYWEQSKLGSRRTTNRS